MVTKEQAVAAHHGTTFHFGECRKIVGPRGGETVKQVRVRVTGQCQTWKTRPEQFRLPVKYGLYESSAITESNAGQYHRPDDCPLNSPVSDDELDPKHPANVMHIKLATNEENIVVEAEKVGDHLYVHRGTNATGHPNEWTLTHWPTGRRVLGRKTREEVMKCVEALKGVDLNFAKQEDAAPETRKAVLALGKEA